MDSIVQNDHGMNEGADRKIIPKTLLRLLEIEENKIIKQVGFAIKGPIKLVKSVDKLHINRYTPPGINVITRALESNQMVEDLIGKTTNLF